MKINILPTVVILFLLLTSQYVQCQISNASFEEWDTSQNILFPVGWKTFENKPLIYRDTISFDGKYSLNIYRDSLSKSCSQSIQIALDSIEILDSSKVLSLHALLKPILQFEGAFLYIELAYYRNNEFLFRDFTYYTKESQEWKQLFLPFRSIDKDAILLTIEGGGAQYDADGCGLKSNIWIDNIRILNKSTSNTENINNQYKTIHLSPNPVMDYLTIDSSKDWQYIIITDFSGRKIIDSTPFQNVLDVSHLVPGFYILQLFDGISSTNKIFVKI